MSRTAQIPFIYEVLDMARGLVTAEGGLIAEAEGVQADARSGYVTLEQAADLYGVILDPDTFEVQTLNPARERTQSDEVHK